MCFSWPPEKRKGGSSQVLLFGTTVSSWSDSFLVSETQIWRKVSVLSTPIFSIIQLMMDVVVICGNLIFVSRIWQCGKKQGAVMSYKSNRGDGLCNHVCISRFIPQSPEWGSFPNHHHPSFYHVHVFQSSSCPSTGYTKA